MRRTQAQRNTTMTCDVCLRHFGPRRRGNCASCTRSMIYEPRVQQASTLLARENFHTHVEAILRPGNDGILASLPQDANWDAIAHGIKAEALQRQQQMFELANDRMRNVLEQVHDIKKQMAQQRDYIDVLKQSNQRRRTELQDKKEELGKNIISDTEPLELGIRKTRHRLQRIHHRSADAKAYLCYTASWLAGLRQQVDQRRKLTGRITLAGLVIHDLREIDGPMSSPSVTGLSDSDPTQFQCVNACLDNTCHLLAIWSHYLQISLPAEIILSHNDFPHAAILHEKSSYRGFDIPYPGGISNHNASPSTSRILTEVQNLPRPRLLHLDRPLSKLVKEDPKAFGMFVEGIVLLAWDLAWLCRTQGVKTINTFDEFCDIGQNLWLLHRAAEVRAQESAAAQHGTDTPAKPGRLMPAQVAHFGGLTHGAVLHSLAGYEGAAVMQNWRLAHPQRLMDKLRSFLLTEMTGAEWDVLSERDFDDDREDEVAVLVGGNQPKRSRASRPGVMSVMSVAPVDTTDASQRNDKGWMKVRGRGTET